MPWSGSTKLSEAEFQQGFPGWFALQPELKQAVAIMLGCIFMTRAIAIDALSDIFGIDHVQLPP